jgi:pilus assembly protein FimV
MKKFACVGNLIIAFGLTFGFNAQALTLGRLSVLSFLGQPLVAEIEVPEISPEESNSLRVGIANAEAFKSAGLDYSAVVAELSITGKRRADGRVILEVRGSQPVTAPFVDLVLEITWNAGRMLRDYTVLLDPPATANQALIVPAPTLPMLSSSSLPSAAASSAPAVAIAAKPQNDEAEQRMPKQVVSTKAKPTAKNSIKIKKGDTAAAIAAANKPEGVSLDQMLVAMLRSNPQAFEGGNVNRLKAGAVMDMPTADDATAIKAQEAKNNIKAQARDFNEYRRRLANNAPASVEKESSRQASGKVIAKVQDRQAVAPSDDRLTLAKPAQAGKAAATEDKIAKERATADANARANELKKNMTELSQLAAKAPAVAQAPAQATTSAPVSAASAVSVPVTLSASAPQPAVSAPPLLVVKPVRPPVSPAPEPSFLDQILTNPLVLPIGGIAVFVFLLGALLVVRRRRRTQSMHTMQDESVGFSQTRQPPTDTIFGPMGASEVDTQETMTQASASSAAYLPGQLSTVTGDVDPIAEADVYLAYNRDVQAEEILKEAKRNAPRRIDVQAKLLEIYAKRQDMEAFDAGAQDLHLLTDGEGEDWAKVRMLARDLGSTHPLFKVSGSAFAVSSESVSTNSSAYSANSLSFLSTPMPPAVAEAPIVEALEAPASSNFGGGLIDFDLSSLTLDLPGSTDSPIQATDSIPVFATDAVEDPKLALAEEYLSIGDKVGARSLIEEVLQQNAHPQTVALAQQMLMRLG